MPTRTPDGATHRLHRLPESGGVALADLSGSEQWFVRALRSIVSAYAGAYGSTSTTPATDGLGAAEPALQRFVEAACEDEASRSCTPATAEGLSSFEAHVLHAIACLQSGLLGEAWKTLAQVCTTSVAGRALLPLEEVAAALAQAGRRLERWCLDDGSVAYPACP